MKVLVPIKRVIDAATNIRVKPDGSGVATDGVKYSMNPFCEVALEEALRIREQRKEVEVVVVSVGDKACTELLRRGLAMGADRGLHVVHDTVLDSFATAEILSAVVRLEEPTLVIVGKQSVDSDANQTGQILAALLSWPQATNASKLEVSEGGESVQVVRDVDGGLETLEFSLPGLVSVDLRLNKARTPTIPGIMAARKKELREFTCESLGVAPVIRVREVRTDSPPKRNAGRKVASVDELVMLLQREARVI